MKTYRQTYVKDTLVLRDRIIRAIRNYFESGNYLEIETPHRIPAPATETHIDAQESEGWYLHTSPELCMKRLLAAGYPRLYQICRCFRKNERGRKHLPEFTMLEWYSTGDDYQGIMHQCEELIQHIARSIDKLKIGYQGETIHLRAPWARMTVNEAFETYASISLHTALENDRFDEIMVSEIEPHLGMGVPLFLFDYPASLGALARLKPQNPLLAERFELYIGGLELCNGFSELTDPTEQKSRFMEEMSQRLLRGKPVYPMPDKFIDSLSDIPAAGGNALGLDRLIMLFADTSNIDDVIAFTPEEL